MVQKSKKKMPKIEDAIKEYEKLQPLYKEFCEKISSIVRASIDKKGIKVHSITHREKVPEKVAEKIEREEKEYTEPLREITDLAGVRVITYFPKDVDLIIPLIESAFEVDWENTVDKRKSFDPDRFGYSSVHYVVSLDSQRLKQVEYSKFKGLKCEIQTRTILQHAWAEIEHDIVYKAQRDIPKELIRRFSLLSGLLELADKEFESIRNDEIKLEEKVSKEIAGKKLDMPIDFISLRNFIMGNKILAQHKDTLTDQRIPELIEEVEIVGIQDIKTLHDVIQAYPQRYEKVFLSFSHKLYLERYPLSHKSTNIGFFRQALAYYNLEAYLNFIKIHRKWSNLDAIIKGIERIMEDKKTGKK